MEHHHILTALMDRLDFLVDQLNMKELLKFAVIMPGEQYHIIGSQIILHKQFAIN